MFQSINSFWQYGFYSLEDVFYFIIAYIILFVFFGFFLRAALGIFQTSENNNYRESFITSIFITVSLVLLSLVSLLFVSWIITLFLAGFIIRWRHNLVYYKAIAVLLLVIFCYFMLYVLFSALHYNRFFVSLIY